MTRTQASKSSHQVPVSSENGRSPVSDHDEEEVWNSEGGGDGDKKVVVSVTPSPSSSWYHTRSACNQLERRFEGSYNPSGVV